MGRLKGVVVGLGMEVSFFLAYLWHYPLAEGAAFPELSQADLRSAAHKFRRYKQDMSEQEESLFTQERIDGKGQPHFFIKCWNGMQLLLQKVHDKGELSCSRNRACMLMFLHAHMHVHMRTHTHARTHARTHTHTLLRSHPQAACFPHPHTATIHTYLLLTTASMRT